MSSYLEEQFNLNDEDLVSVFDELPLWSSYFGTKLLEYIDYKNNLKVLDIGCGAGFPLIELAQRLGSSSTVYGIDVWTAAFERVRLKLKKMKINNVIYLNQPAESLPFKKNSFDLIVSNNGINNVQDPYTVLSESYRVMKEGAQFIFSVNLPETMTEFYNIFQKVLEKHSLNKEIGRMQEHIKSKRKSVEEYLDMLDRMNYKVKNIIEDKFYMQYADGSAFLNHFFIKLAFLDSWKNVIQKERIKEIFIEIERDMNKKAEEDGHLKLTIPFIVINSYK